MFRGFPLKAKDEVCERTASPSIIDKLLIISSVSPSAKYLGARFRAPVFEGQDSNANGRYSCLSSPPPTDADSDHRKDNSARKPQTPPRKPALAVTEHRPVRTLRYVDDRRIALTLTRVVLDEARAKPPRFGPHYRVELGVVIRAAAEHLDGNQRFLDLVILPVQVPFHQKSQE